MNRKKLLLNQFVSPFWRSAEEDELQYLKSRGFPMTFAKCLQQRKAYRFHQEAHSCTYTHTVTAAPRYEYICTYLNVNEN